MQRADTQLSSACSSLGSRPPKDPTDAESTSEARKTRRCTHQCDDTEGENEAVTIEEELVEGGVGSRYIRKYKKY